MKKFEVCIRGDNFLISRDGERPAKTGFYAARFVETMDMSTAVEQTMNSFRSDLKGQVLNKDDDAPQMKVVDVGEVYYFQDAMSVGNKRIPGEGFVWDEVTVEVHEEAKPLSTWTGGWSGLLESFRSGDIHIHTMLIHFTNALFPVALLFLFLALILGSSALDKTYFYVMIIATISSPLSYVSGLYEWKRKHQGAMVAIFKSKIRFGLLVFLLGAFVTLWRYFAPGVILSPGIMTVPFVLLNLSVLAPIVYLGHLGGIIVYEGVER